MSYFITLSKQRLAFTVNPLATNAVHIFNLTGVQIYALISKLNLALPI